jgi:hypothetical protein
MIYLINQARAADLNQVNLNGVSGLSGLTSIDALITNIINLVFLILGIAAFVGVVYSGFMMITSGGDATKFATGRKNLLWAVIGIIVIILSFFLVKTVYNFAGHPVNPS